MARTESRKLVLAPVHRNFRKSHRRRPLLESLETRTLLDFGLTAFTGAFTKPNVALDGYAFAKDLLLQPNGAAYSQHLIYHLNDGTYGNDHSWIGASDPSWAAIDFKGPTVIEGVAWGRDNTYNPNTPNTYKDRSKGIYTLEYTTVPDPSILARESDWTPIGQKTYDSDNPLRHAYTFAPVTATGVRLKTDSPPSSGGDLIALDELEVYGTLVSTTVATVVSIDVTPVNPTVAVGSTLQLTATARFSDGSSGVLPSWQTWGVFQPGIATIAKGGLATGVSAGSTMVRVSYGNKNGDFTLTVTPSSTPPGNTGLTEFTGAFTKPNVALQSAGGSAFAKDLFLQSNGQPYPQHTYEHLNDGKHGNSFSWIGATDPSYAAIRFPQPTLIEGVAWGRDNTYNPNTPNTYKDRSKGTYILEYTTATNPGTGTPDSQWVEIGRRIYDNDNPLRHAYTFAPVTATAVRLKTDSPSSAGGDLIAIDELEVYGTAPQAPTGTLLSIALTAEYATVGMGLTSKFTAIGTYSDGRTWDISSQVTWSSDLLTVATVGPSGLARGLRPGTATIRATLGAKTAASSLTTANLLPATTQGTPGNDVVVVSEVIEASGAPSVDLASITVNNVLIGYKFKHQLDYFVLGDGNDLFRLDRFSNSSTTYSWSAVLVIGGTGNDTIQCGDGNDRIYGGGGDDSIIGGGGNDWIDGEIESGTNGGGVGNDWIDGGDGNDTIWGSNGDHNYSYTGGRDTILGGNGNDKIEGRGGNNLIYGGAGNDTLGGDAGHDTIYGDSGEDQINGGQGNDYLNGGDDLDRIDGGDGNDTLIGGNGGDVLVGRAGNDRIEGGTGENYLDGGAGDDYLIDVGTYNPFATGSILDGGAGNDTLIGGLGNDKIYGAAQPYVAPYDPSFGTGIETTLIDGGPGNDTLIGTDGKDTINGGDGDDYIVGAGGWDSLLGGNGRDAIYGGPGDDTINGGEGRDNLDGGTENNTLIPSNGDYSGVDTVRNFAGITFHGTPGNDVILITWYTDAPEGPEVLQPPFPEHHDFITVDINGVKTSMEYTPHDNGPKPTVTIYGEEGDDFIQMTDQGAGQHWDADFHGGPGNDTLIASTQLFGKERTSYLYGEEGNDTLVGGAGEAFLSGGPGNDTITGGTAHNVIVGGTGWDLLRGGTGGSILIAGTTSRFDDKSAVDKALADWGAPVSYPTRALSFRLGFGGFGARRFPTIVRNWYPTRVLATRGQDLVIGGPATRLRILPRPFLARTWAARLGFVSR